jgi:hypothetical protein
MVVRDYEIDDLDDDDDDNDNEEWDDNDDETMPCPHCQGSVYDDAERCPNCGLYLSREDDPSRKPWWVVAGVFACLAMVTWWILNP